jgi:hypothetical protein
VKTKTDINKAIALQSEMCAKTITPHLAPDDGICSRCHRNIYQDYTVLNGRPGREELRGETGERIVTGCPHCFHSFCE